MKSFIQYLESLKEDVPANCMGGGQIATFDPVMKIKKAIQRRKDAKTGK